MKGSEILSHVDHTLLKPTATWEQIQSLCQEAIDYNTASICIPASYVAPVHKKYGEKINICTVIGFPLGYDSTEAKIKAAEQSILDGAKEVDMVINITDAKNGAFDRTGKNPAMSLRDRRQGGFYQNIHRIRDRGSYPRRHKIVS